MSSHELAAVIEETAREVGYSGVVSARVGSDEPIVCAFGHEDRARGIPITAESRFAIASGAKTFTAVAVCQLVERGALTLDTRLRDCLDVDFPKASTDVTVRQLLQHTSGMPDYFDEEVMSDYEELWRDRPMYSIKRLHDFLPLFREAPMKDAPGDQFSYNNAGYIVLGLIVEQASGMRFDEYVVQNVFAPVGMKASGYFETDRLPDKVALGYIEDPDESARGWRTNFFAVPIVGGSDGGVFVSAGDLDLFWVALSAGRLVSDAMQREMQQPLTATGETDHGTHYGRGFWLTLQGEETVAVFMIGGDPGVEFYSALFPRTGARLTLLANSERGAVALRRKLRSLLCGE